MAAKGDGWTLPRRYGVTTLYRVLRVMERFGWTPREWDAIDRAQMNVLLEYDRLRQHEEAQS